MAEKAMDPHHPSFRIFSRVSAQLHDFTLSFSASLN
jgi:hypothetical protein